MTLAEDREKCMVKSPGSACLLSLLLATAVGADILETREGRQIQGTFHSATQQAIHFEIDGSVRVVPLDQVLKLTFTSPPRDTSDASAATPSPRAGAARVTVPAGTRLRARLLDTIDPQRNATGDRFSALLELPLSAGGVEIAPTHAKVYGVVSGARATGPVAGRIELELTQLLLGGQMATIVTGTHRLVSSDPDGDLPAKASASGGAPARVDRITSGTLLEFRLLQPLELRLD
jgi:hypothetical protein